MVGLFSWDGPSAACLKTVAAAERRLKHSKGGIRCDARFERYVFWPGVLIRSLQEVNTPQRNCSLSADQTPSLCDISGRPAKSQTAPGGHVSTVKFWGKNGAKNRTYHRRDRSGRRLSK